MVKVITRYKGEEIIFRIDCDLLIERSEHFASLDEEIHFCEEDEIEIIPEVNPKYFEMLFDPGTSEVNYDVFSF